MMWQLGPCISNQEVDIFTFTGLIRGLESTRS